MSTSDELFKFSFVVILGEEIEAEEDAVPNNEEGGDEGVVVESYNGVIMLEDEGDESEDHDDDDDDDEDDEGSEEKCSVECSEFAALFHDQPQSLQYTHKRRTSCCELMKTTLNDVLLLTFFNVVNNCYT